MGEDVPLITLHLIYIINLGRKDQLRSEGLGLYSATATFLFWFLAVFLRLDFYSGVTLRSVSDNASGMFLHHLVDLLCQLGKELIQVGPILGRHQEMTDPILLRILLSLPDRHTPLYFHISFIASKNNNNIFMVGIFPKFMNPLLGPIERLDGNNLIDYNSADCIPVVDGCHSIVLLLAGGVPDRQPGQLPI